MPDTEPLFFSIIIPVHNKQDCIGNTISCLEKQTFRDFETIFIDDCSSDGSASILREASRLDGVRLYRRDTPGPGGYEARNLGASKALGDWLVFFDADDELLSDHLAHHHANICRNLHIDLFANAYQILRGGRPWIRRDLSLAGVLSRRQALELISRFDFMCMNSFAIRKTKFLSLNGFPENRFRRGGDLYFWIRALANIQQIHYSHQVTSNYLVDNSTVTIRPENMVPHPLGTILKNEDFSFLPAIEKKYIYRTINRKILLWARQKRKAAVPFRRDFARMKFTQLSKKQLVVCAWLMLPWHRINV